MFMSLCRTGRNLVLIWDMTGRCRGSRYLKEVSSPRSVPAGNPRRFLNGCSVLLVSSLGVATGESPGKNTDESPF